VVYYITFLPDGKPERVCVAGAEAQQALGGSDFSHEHDFIRSSG
jgi:hypothetical protein